MSRILLLLHPSPCYIPSDPRSHILIDLDHNEEYNPVYDYHAQYHTQIYPFWSVHIDLEHVFQDVLARDLWKIWWLVVEQQPFQIILVLTLKIIFKFRKWMIKFEPIFPSLWSPSNILLPAEPRNESWCMTLGNARMVLGCHLGAWSSQTPAWICPDIIKIV